MTVFRVQAPLFQQPGTAETRTGTGLFRVFRVFRAIARIYARTHTHTPTLFFTRAINSFPARIQEEHPEHPEQPSKYAASGCSGLLEQKTHTRNSHARH